MSRSEPKGFRRFLPLLSLVAVLLLATAFVLLLPQIKKAVPAKETPKSTYTPTYQTVAKIDEATLETITVTHLGEAPYTLVNQDGILSLHSADGSLEAIDAAASDNFIKYATTIYVEDTIATDANEIADQLSDMGLNPPQITATAAFSDGSEISIQLGSKMLDTTYRYYMWSGDNAVYLCNSGVVETFGMTADRLRMVTQPGIIASLVERVTIRQGDGAPIICSLEKSAEDTVYGTMQSPYAYPMSSQTAKSLLTAVESFRLGARLGSVTDDTLSLYGLDTPQAVVTIEQRGGRYTTVGSNGALQTSNLEPDTFTLTLGSADGDFFRYCAFEGTCYRVSEFLVSAFLDAAAADYATKNPVDMNGDALQSIAIRTSSGSLLVEAQYLETVLPNNDLLTDEYGNIIYTTEATCNGEPITAEAFEELVARLWQLSVSGSLPKADAPGGTPLWRITLETTQGKSRMLAAYPMDAFNDVLAVDGVAVHYISKEALDIALGEFAALLYPQETP